MRKFVLAATVAAFAAASAPAYAVPLPLEKPIAKGFADVNAVAAKVEGFAKAVLGKVLNPF
jgi:hypothetical protein